MAKTAEERKYDRILREEELKIKAFEAAQRGRAEQTAADAVAARKGELKLRQTQDKRAAVDWSVRTFQITQPLIIGIIGFLFLLGPGAAIIVSILGQLNWWMILGGIVVGILLWRRAL